MDNPQVVQVRWRVRTGAADLPVPRLHHRRPQLLAERILRRLSGLFCLIVMRFKSDFFTSFVVYLLIMSYLNQEE